MGVLKDGDDGGGGKGGGQRGKRGGTKGQSSPTCTSLDTNTLGYFLMLSIQCV